MTISHQLIKDCVDKNRKAQFQLYKSCFNVLMGVCMRYKQDEQEAAEVLNAGFLKVLNNLDKYDSKAPFEPWIKRIMINTIIDEFRKNRKVRELIEYKDFSEEQNQNDFTDLNMADKLFDIEQLERLIRCLPAVSQKVFNLFAIDGYGHKEIGNLLNISEGTSKWHLSFARKKIKEMLENSINSTKVS